MTKLIVFLVLINLPLLGCTTCPSSHSDRWHETDIRFGDSHPFGKGLR